MESGTVDTGASPKAQPKLFSRQASGLIREFGFFDSFVFNSVGACFGLVIAVTPFFIGSVFPGVNVWLVLVIGLILAVFNGFTYSMLSSAMPRSGGEYVYNGRVLHPALGFMSSWGITIAWFMGIAIYLTWTINYAISVAASTIGYASGNQSIIDFGSWIAGTWPSFIFGAVLLGIVVLVQLAGMRFMKTMMNWLFVVAMGGTIITLVVFLMNDHQSFIDNFNRFMLNVNDQQDAYNALLTQAKDAGQTFPKPGIWGTVMALPLAYWMVVGFVNSAYIGGEVKEPQKTQFRAVLGALFAAFAIYFVMLAAYYRVVGTEFNDAAAHLQFIGESPLPVAGVVNFFAGVLTDNTLVNVLIGLSFFLWHFLLLFVMFTVISRNTFAWAFDQIMPAKLTSVTSGGVPIGSIIVTAICVFIILILVSFTTIFSYIYNYTVQFSIAYWITSFAAILLPYRRKDLFEAAPPSVRRRIAGIPLVTIAGLINLVLFSLILYSSFRLPAFSGPTGVEATLFVILSYVSGLVIYFAVAAYRNRQGVDLSLLYGEIPPE